MNNRPILNNAPQIDGDGSYKKYGNQIANGNPLEFNILKLLRQEYGKWLYNPEQGSKLYKLQNIRGSINQSVINQYINEALQPLITQNKMTILSIRLLVNNLQNIVELTVLDNRGKELILNIPSIYIIKQLQD